MQIGFCVNLRNLLMGFRIEETRQPVYREFPAGFTREMERLVHIDVLRKVTFNPLPFVSLDFTWKIYEDHEHLHSEHADAYGHYTDGNAEYSWPNDGEII